MSTMTRFGALAILWPIVAAGTGAASAADDTIAAAEQVLKDKGLTKADRKFLLDEAAALKKYDSAKALYADYQKAFGRLAVIVEYDEAMQAMEAQRQTLQQQNAALQMQLKSAANSGGRMQRLVNAGLAPVRQQVAENQAAITQMNAQIQAAKAQAPKAEDRKAVPAEVDRTRQAFVDTVRELSELVAPLLAKYHELGLDKTVTDALVELRHSTTRNYKLGPSDQLLAAARMVQDVKKNTTGTTKPASKKKAKTKASASPASAKRP